MRNERLRVLCVDDEPNMVEAEARTLRRDYEVTTAPGGQAGLEALEREGPFAVVISDLRMPGMDGVEFLRQIRERSPDTVRILLTGQADLDATIAVVNEGQIFRFLCKPCPPAVLLSTMGAAARQYQLVMAERVLLEQTLRGSVQTLTDILALISPAAFGRATRAKQYVCELLDRLGPASRWETEVAAMLSQIGCVTLPTATVEKVYRGLRLEDTEQAMVERLPAVTERLLANIPRLEPVRLVLRYQAKNFDGSGRPADQLRGQEIPLGARVLRVALDFDELESQGLATDLALDTLRGRLGIYDPQLLQVFAEIRGAAELHREVREIRLRDVRCGMVFGEDVMTVQGALLIARGQGVTEGLEERIRNLSKAVAVREPVRVLIPPDAGHCAAVESPAVTAGQR